jgi:hypothetical protein
LCGALYLDFVRRTDQANGARAEQQRSCHRLPSLSLSWQRSRLTHLRGQRDGSRSPVRGLAEYFA